MTNCRMAFELCGWLHHHPFTLCACKISVSDGLSRMGFTLVK